MNRYTKLGFALLITVPVMAMKTELHNKAADCYAGGRVKEILSGAPQEIGKKDGDGNIPLHEAAYFGCLGNAELLLNAGSHINERNYKNETPIDKAHYNKKPAVETFLRLRGGQYSIYNELNQRPVPQEGLDNFLWDVLFNYDLMRLALEKGANPNAMRDSLGVKMAPLHYIAQRADYKTPLNIMEVLLEFRADINKRDSEGWTPGGRAGQGADSQTGDYIVGFFRKHRAEFAQGAPRGPQRAPMPRGQRFRK